MVNLPATDQYTQAESAVKLPPHDLDAEEAVLGSLLLDPTAIAKVSGWLKAEDFYREKHRWTYECCLAVHQQNTPTDQISVAHEMARRRQLESAGGAMFISHLVSSTPTSVFVDHYGSIVQKLSLLRQLLAASNQIAAIAYEVPETFDTALCRAEGILARLRSGSTRKRGGFPL